MGFSPKNIILGLATTAAIAAAGITYSPPSANAGSISDAAQFMSSNWGAFVSNLWSPWNKQVFMTNLSWQETRDVRNQYRDRADGVLNDRCINKVTDMYYSGWQRNVLKTSHRWVFATRVENNQANCFQRMPNNIADNFIRRRGW